MIRAIALDDEPLALDAVKSLTEEFDYIHLEKTFTRPSEALKHIEENPIDLVFLDINMPEVSGLEFAIIIKRFNIMVVFTTAYDHYAVESYSLDAIDYLLKPISKKRFNQSMMKVFDHYGLNRFHKTPDGFIFVRADFSRIKLILNDILYIEGMADYVKIHVKERKTIVSRMTVKGIMNLLPNTDFLRVHRSFIVPINRITAINSKLIELPERDIPIGHTYQKTLSKLSIF